MVPEAPESACAPGFHDPELGTAPESHSPDPATVPGAQGPEPVDWLKFFVFAV